MSNLPRFMVAENPMAELNVEYVIHTQRPRFIARRVYDNPLSDFEIVEEIDSFAEAFAGNPSKIAKLMSRLGDWWVAYCRWEEEHREDEDDENL